MPIAAYASPPDPQDLQDVDQRLDVVDAGRLAEHASLHGERRLVPRLAALALDRVEQRRLLAADVGAGAPPKLDVEGEPLAHHVVAEEPVATSLRDGVIAGARSRGGTHRGCRCSPGRSPSRSRRS